MAALDKQHGCWYAFVADGSDAECVEIVRTKWDHESYAHYWCTKNGVGVWPGTDSPDWIEYVPDGGHLEESFGQIFHVIDDGTGPRYTKVADADHTKDV